jgi:hypothetical protein
LVLFEQKHFAFFILLANWDFALFRYVAVGLKSDLQVTLSFVAVGLKFDLQVALSFVAVGLKSDLQD